MIMATSRKIPSRSGRSGSCMTPSTTQKMSTVMSTGAGSIHYIEKQVCLGLRAIKEAEQSEMEKYSREEIPSTKLRRSKSENAINRIDDSSSPYNQLPSRGEIRHVHLDMTWTRFGFRLQVWRERIRYRMVVWLPCQLMHVCMLLSIKHSANDIICTRT